MYSVITFRDVKMFVLFCEKYLFPFKKLTNFL